MAAGLLVCISWAVLWGVLSWRDEASPGWGEARQGLEEGDKEVLLWSKVGVPKTESAFGGKRRGVDGKPPVSDWSVTFRNREGDVRAAVPASLESVAKDGSIRGLGIRFSDARGRMDLAQAIARVDPQGGVYAVRVRPLILGHSFEPHDVARGTAVLVQLPDMGILRMILRSSTPGEQTRSSGMRLVVRAKGGGTGHPRTGVVGAYPGE